jgi:hypothetical protein
MTLFRRFSYSLFVWAAVSVWVEARPSAPFIFCATYPEAAACRGGRVVACTTCHTSPPEFNTYGLAVAENRPAGVFEQVLTRALAAVEPLDSDGDGLSNLAEIAGGTAPGDRLSLFRMKSGAKPRTYDPAFAYKRLSAAFCGISPSYQNMRDLNAAQDRTAFLHARLDECLKSNYWKFEALARMADEKVRPVAAMGHCMFTFTDFEKDYHLFGFTMTGGRDVREMLTAKYHVRRAADSYEVIDESAGPAGPPPTRAGVGCGANSPGAGMFGALLSARQATAPEYRAGMWTTQHSVVMGTAGTLMPRVTAAAAYRNYLGYELSQYEGIHSVLNEPRDIDRKGVAQRSCANCHAALDPLTYAFAYYWGAGGNGKEFGQYDADRPATFKDVEVEIVADWLKNEPQPALLGRNITKNSQARAGSSLVEMAATAADSGPFAFNIVRMVYRHATGGPPEPTDWREIQILVDELRARRYSVDSMIHRMIDTLAFGGVQ